MAVTVGDVEFCDVKGIVLHDSVFNEILYVFNVKGMAGTVAFNFDVINDGFDLCICKALCFDNLLIGLSDGTRNLVAVINDFRTASFDDLHTFPLLNLQRMSVNATNSTFFMPNSPYLVFLVSTVY